MIGNGLGSVPPNSLRSGALRSGALRSTGLAGGGGMAGGSVVRSGVALASRGPLRQRSSVLGSLDWALILSVIGLSIVGALLVWSATRTGTVDGARDPAGFLKRHLLNLSIGFVLFALFAMLDYRLLRAYAPILYIVTCIGLIAVLSPLGATINGSHSWIVLGGGFQVQPSEFAKVGLVVLLAMLYGEPRDGEVGPGTRDILLGLVLAVLPAVLILMQPDLGTALVFGAVLLGMLAISGVSRLWLLGLVGTGLAAIAIVLWMDLLEPYQIARFTAFVNPDADPRGAGYNAQQARIAVGSGGVSGKGLFNGEQTSGHFVPEQQTDFIFTVAGEELGFVGSAVILLLLFVILWRALRIATQAGDLCGRLVAAGIACWFTFQTFQNIGMTVGIMPITGLPLPFVSYGGSATFANMVALGLLQSIFLRRNHL